MTTPYDVIDNNFLSKISDSYLASIDVEDLQDIIDKYRTSAEPKFKQCKKLNDKDGVLRQYNQELTNEEVEILANLMVIEWLRPTINSMEILKQSMSTKDYKLSSQAEHLLRLQNLKSETNKEISRLIVSYTYSSKSLDDLKVNNNG